MIALGAAPTVPAIVHGLGLWLLLAVAVVGFLEWAWAIVGGGGR